MVIWVANDNCDMRVTNTIYDSYFAIAICNMQVVDDICFSQQQPDCPLSPLSVTFLSPSFHCETLPKHHEVTHPSPRLPPLSLFFHHGSANVLPKQPPSVTITTYIIHLEVYWTLFLYQFDVIYANVYKFDFIQC
jgi:hypothetical protein